jgi:serine/threonine protein kinase
MAWREGEQVGPYLIDRQLGVGGMATVYKAYHPQLDRYVAIKVVKSILLDDPSFIQRFTREAQIVANLEHPNIVPVYDFNSHQGQPYLVMKYLEGMTLKDRMLKGKLYPQEIIRIIEAVGSALTYAHRKGVLHRDVKPSNIILGQDQTIYLTDFGLARLVRAGESTMSADTLLGTPHYLSPEQARGLKDIDGRADIYSLGIVIYEMLTGRTPFASDSTYAIIHDHVNTPPPDMRQFNPQIDEAVEIVVMTALAKDPGVRYSSGDELSQALGIALSHVEIDGEAYGTTPKPPLRTTTQMQALGERNKTPTPVMGQSVLIAASTGSSVRSGYIVDEVELESHQDRLWIISGCGAFLAACFLALVTLLGAADRLAELGRLGSIIAQDQGLQSLELGSFADVERFGVRVEIQNGLEALVIPETTMSNAMKLRQEDQMDLASYLILANAYWQEQKPSESWRVIREGYTYANNKVVYIISAVELARRHYDPIGAVGYAVYGLMLLGDAPSIRPLQEELSAILYEFAPVLSHEDLQVIVDQVLTRDLLTDEQAQSLQGSVPTLFVEALRTFGKGDYVTARTILGQIEGDRLRFERSLLELEIKLALQETDDLADELEDLIEDGFTPRWVVERALKLQEDLIHKGIES